MSEATETELPLKHAVLVFEYRDGEPWPVWACEFRDEGARSTIRGAEQSGAALPFLLAATRRCTRELVVEQLVRGPDGDLLGETTTEGTENTEGGQVEDHALAGAATGGESLDGPACPLVECPYHDEAFEQSCRAEDGAGGPMYPGCLKRLAHEGATEAGRSARAPLLPQCFFGIAGNSVYPPQPRCPKAGTWRSPNGKIFWCDEHRHPKDTPVQPGNHALAGAATEGGEA